MKLIIKSIVIALCFILSLHATFAHSAPINIDQQTILKNAKDLNPKALELAVNGYHWAAENNEIDNTNVLTIVDFTIPSNKKRVWVIDLKTSKTLMKLYTTQAKNSGLVKATHFSNKPNSEQSSLGVFKTLNSYYGKHGKSLRLQGLEPGINSNALKRAIVVHPAWYVTPDFILKNNRAGRSWGCFAVNPAISKKLIDTIKGGSIIFAYAKPEHKDPIVAG